MTMTQDTSGTQDVLRYLTEDATSQFAGQSVTIRDRWQGRDNLLWRFEAGNQEAVLKLYLEAGQVRADRQFNGQERFAPWGLAPRPLWQERQPETLPRPILVYEWSDGEALEVTNLDHTDALVDAVVQIHQEGAGEYGRFSPHPVNLAYFWRVLSGSRQPLHQWLKTQAPALDTWLAHLWSAVEPWMETALPITGETAPTLVHGELMIENILFQRGQALLLDWEFFGIGDPAQEVARFLFYHANQIDDAVRERWLQRYLARMDDDSLAMRVDLYQRLLPLQSLTFLLNGIQRELIENPAQQGTLDEERAVLVEIVTATCRDAVATILAEEMALETVQEELKRLLAHPGQ